MRILPLSPPWPADVRAGFEAIMPPGLEPLLLFRTLANSPRAWARFRAGALLDNGPLDLRSREIVILRTCALTGCEYEWGVHVSLFARAAGLDQAQIAATLGRVDEHRAGFWTEKEGALLVAADALHDRSALSDAEYGALAAAFAPDQIVEVLMLAGYYRTVSYLCGGLTLPLEPFAARFADYRGP